MDPVVRAFDAIAERYAEDFADELERKPFDRDQLDRFASGCPAGLVVDVGCGAAGHVGAYLARRGRQVVGLDASVRSLTVAAHRVDQVSFVAGDLRGLPLRDGSVAGIVAFYCHIYDDLGELERELVELHRVLRPGGWLLAATHAGSGAEHFDDYQGIEVDVTIVLRDPDEFAAAAARAGFDVGAVTVRPPYPDEHAWDRLYVLATA